MEKLKLWLADRIAACEQAEAAFKEDGRDDEAVLEKIGANIYGIFISVIDAGRKATANPEEHAAFFERSLERIPSGWRIARDKAAERKDAVRLAQEEAKLAAIEAIEQAYRTMREGVR